MPSPSPTPRREKKSTAGAAGPSRSRSCPFCTQKTDEVDFKDFSALRRLMSEKGNQNQVTVAVKRAREMALLPNASR
jgi:small subunit ribosomal protein S18